MGRLSRHKRVKAFDPFSRRHVTRLDSCEDNNPVSAGVKDEQPLSRSLKTFLRERDGSRKRRKRKALTSEDTHDTDKRQSNVFERQEGEATSSYFDRMDRETMTILHKHNKLIGKTGQKRKRFMETKESKRRSKRQEAVEEKLMGFNQLQDTVQFGEVVQAPPVLSVKPRKAPHKQDVHRKSLEKERLRVINQYRQQKQRTKVSLSV